MGPLATTELAPDIKGCLLDDGVAAGFGVAVKLEADAQLTTGGVGVEGVGFGADA